MNRFMQLLNRTGFASLALAASLVTQGQAFVLQVSGSLPTCIPGTAVFVSDSTGAGSNVATVAPDCSFSVELISLVPSGTIIVQALCADGAEASGSAPYAFVAPDTIDLQIQLTCAPPPLDCNGVPGGPAQIGASCDDGVASTVYDAWGPDCICAGFDSTQVVLDCLGQPFGPNMPGMPCFDTLLLIPFGIWTTDCACALDSSLFPPDCLGVLGGPNHPGGLCDDGDASTDIDLWSNDCLCIGYDSSQVIFDCLGVPNGGNLPGTFCSDQQLPFLTGVWGPDCVCVLDSSFWIYNDCLGMPFGPNTPGSACIFSADSITFFPGIWDANCACLPDTGSAPTDCLGISGGPNVPGAPCVFALDSLNTVFGFWAADCTCQPNTFDCTGIPGGPNVPGSPCDDGDPLTLGDAWSLNCVCTGVDTTLVADCLGVIGGVDLPGAPCFVQDSLFFIFGVWTPDCLCVSDTFFIQPDCLGVIGGTAVPGTTCDDGDPLTTFDYWDPSCTCIGLDSANVVFDCLGIPNGPNVAGAPCASQPDSNFVLIGLWGQDCVCYSTVFDCTGVPGGAAVPGSPCDDGDPLTLNDVWSPYCTCGGAGAPTPCQAGFFVVPTYVDTTASVPTELWIWNTSMGGSGALSYFWEFGDGATSTDAWPVHSYTGFGPFLLCLTVSDSTGCSSTYCDTLEVGTDGLFRNGGFTMIVQQALMATAVEEPTGTALPEPTLWPNPVAQELNIAFASDRSGNALLQVLDLNGRAVRTERAAMMQGENRFALPTSGLAPGIYFLSISVDERSTRQRFVKVD